MVRRKHRAQVAYSADFETTTDPDDCRVWAWGLYVIGGGDETFEWSQDVDSFIERAARDSSSIVYFHNLKFDGFFILDALLKDDYKYVEEHPNDGEFTTLISDTGKFYSITVRWRNGHKTEFRDSLKKLPFSVAEVARAFDQAESKGEIDYRKY